MIEWWWLLVAFYAGGCCCMLAWVYAAGPVLAWVHAAPAHYLEGDWRWVAVDVLLWPIVLLGWLSDH